MFWVMNYTYMFDGMAYFGILTLLTIFLHENIGLPDRYAHLIVSVYTGLVTAFMLIFGPKADKIGIKKALIAALVLSIIGRIFLCHPQSAKKRGKQIVRLGGRRVMRERPGGGSAVQPHVVKRVLLAEKGSPHENRRR